METKIKIEMKLRYWYRERRRDPSPSDEERERNIENDEHPSRSTLVPSPTPEVTNEEERKRDIEHDESPSTPTLVPAPTSAVTNEDSFIRPLMDRNSSAESNKKTLVYKKALTEEDLNQGMVTVPAEPVEGFFPEPVRSNRKQNNFCIQVTDRKGLVWKIETLFDELSHCYMLLSSKWEGFVEEHELKAKDMILFYYDHLHGCYLIEYEKAPEIHSHST